MQLGPLLTQSQFLLAYNAELRGAKPIGEASRSNDVFGVED